MKNILLIGVGGAGSKTVEIFYKNLREFGSQNDNNITAIVFDTDKGDLDKISYATTIPMADPASVGTICDRLGKKYLREWFPCDDKAVRSQEMIRGASQWRKKSYLAFLNLMNKPEMKTRFVSALEKMVADPNASCEVYVISSVAGGTGSGSFIPIALYAKKFLRRNMGKDPIVNAMILLPDIYKEMQTADNRIKVVANAYAILRELNAINLVARNYNQGDRFDRKRAKINIRIGSPDEPNVGVLFDSNDEEYWTPSAAPFSQVFMLDKMIDVAPYAHNIVLANALYALICTKTGAEFDSEASNHEVSRSQNNGANAIFAGIATSQITFPKDSLLAYLAHTKALSSCNEEWLAIYREAEAKIKERQKQAKEMGDRFVMKNGEYAEIVGEVIEKFEENNQTNILDILNLGTVDKEDDENAEEAQATEGDTRAERYYNKLKKYIESRLPKGPEMPTPEEGVTPDADAVLELAEQQYKAAKRFFAECNETRRKLRSSIADAILCFGSNADLSRNEDLSLEENLLRYGTKSSGRKYIHPLAALAQLCELKRVMMKDKVISGTKQWEETRGGVVDESTFKKLCELTENDDSRSKYAAAGTSRFVKFGKKDAGDYTGRGTNRKSDYEYICKDTAAVFGTIRTAEKAQLQRAVLERVSANLDLLIEKYRTFFKRFEKERETLAEMTADALYLDSGVVNGAVNVLASQESKKKVEKEVFGNAGSETEEDIAEMYDIVGKSVYKTVYTAAAAAKNAEEAGESADKKYNDKDSAAYRSLFGEMIASYRKFISKDDAFKEIGDSCVIRAIELECDNPGNADEVTKKLKDYFNAVTTRAVPSVMCKQDGDLDLIMQSTIMVYMMSKGTAQYIKRHASFYGINIPAGKTSEDELIEACAKAFVQKYSDNQSARTVIADAMPDNTIYCTGEIMDITPMRVDKFDEFSTDENAFYRAYRIAVENSEKYDTDMWNPHLGKDWHKRGYLPYLNDAMEEACDKKMAKALLYALAKGKIVLSELAGSNLVFRNKIVDKPINTQTGEPINMKNVAQLVNWIRNEDAFVEENSKAFDELINHFKNSLTNASSAQDVSRLKSEFTTSEFIGWMTNSLFSFEPKTAKKIAPSILEFAYDIKISEESGRDNDDAERIASVAYDTFKDICACRTNPETNAEGYIEIYLHELEKILVGIAESKIVLDSGKDGKAQFEQVIVWLNSAGLFLDIDPTDPLETDGKTIKYRNYVIPEKANAVSAALKKSESAAIAEKASAEKAAAKGGDDNAAENASESAKQNKGANKSKNK